MKTILSIKNLAFLLIILMMSTFCFSQNIKDSEWQFKLDIPSSWSKTNYMDGNDKVYDFYSSDQNAAVQLRILTANAQVTYDLLIPLYEENMLSSATRVDLKDITSKNGIPGKQAIYSMNYNGTDVGISIFYTLQNSKAYIFSVMAASSVAENYRDDIQSITASFTIDGVGQKPQAKSGLGGIAGMMNKQKKKQQIGSSNNSSIVGRYMFDYSSGDNRTNFNNIYINEDGSYKHEYQPKNSGNYVGGSKGRWKLDGNTLYLTHSGGGIVDTYDVNGRRLIRTTSSGSMVYFKE